jgi:hypothetical protein
MGTSRKDCGASGTLGRRRILLENKGKGIFQEMKGAKLMRPIKRGFKLVLQNNEDIML